MDQQPASNSSPSSAASPLEEQHNGSSNTNGNANNEIAEVDQLVQTSAESIAAFQVSYTQAHDQITWLPLGPGYVHNLLGQSVVTSTPSSDNSSDQQDPTSSETNPTRSMDTSSQLYTISSPSSTTTSNSPPGSAAILCSPPSSLLTHQGMFIDVLSRTSQAGGSQDDEEESQVVCLWDGCNQEFSSLSQLVSHLDKGHTLSMSQYICYWKDCPRNLKPFDARYKLITHLRCHTGEKPFRCEVPTCNRCFSRLENLKLHVRTHTGEKPYECHYEGCSKKFNNTSDRAKHMKTHVMRKPYACKYPGCEKSYTDPSSMRKHIKYSHKLKERQERGSSSGSSTETQVPLLEANVVAPPEVSSQSTSSARTPSLSPSSFVFHSPTVTALSPPIHSPHASLPQESARIAHSSTNLKKMVNGAPLIASGPLITSPSQLAPAPQLIPIPLLQLPPGASLQHQLLGLLPQAQKSMIVMSSPSPVESPQPIPKQSVIQVLPESSSAPTITVSLSDGAGTSSQSERRGDEVSQQMVEAQLRQKILQLQQELSHTQSLLAHQNAAMLNQNQTVLAQPPLVVQQVPNTNCLATTRAVTSVTQNGHIVISETPHVPNTTPLAVSLAPLPITSSASSPQIIPIVNSQGFQFLYTPPIPHSSV